ncbi:2,3-bisphosphoglycerate-dependent phosphoglycerate mutase [Halopelagius inordinatus]|uniref:2,3-bisphosphoglycerate-dependent phosphoglycerate mutase n=1 Tax=Halopelagius inordinatus TaxID=553467 RepID=A0A1I2LKL5_9EURY|nr:histidine phosphatase family protein [Halopelagius inordinatus]SFF77606.1 2,3-bisphosphoglycerate-dependent phosphoglycerate mutase [Halopelagius inordinatus]
MSAPTEPTRITFVCRAASSGTPGPTRTPGLSRRGRRDAARLTAHLLELEPVDVVVASPRPSARQTVAGVADGADVPLLTDERFRKRRLSGTAVADRAEARDRLWADPTASNPGGESHREAQKRAVAALERILDAYPGRHVVVGTHATTLALVLNAFDPRYGRAFRDGVAEPDAYQATFVEGDLFGVGRVWADELATNDADSEARADADDETDADD